jgi:septin family protein
MIRRKKNVKKGIQFCLMVCGASGTGKFMLRDAAVFCQPSSLPLMGPVR